MTMDLQWAIEWLIDQVVQGEWETEDSPDLRRLRTEGYLADVDVVIPYQWMLCTKEVPGARAALRKAIVEMRQTLDELEALLDGIDAAETEAQAAGHPNWAPLIAVLKAPFELQKPEVCDPTDVNCIAVMLRDMLSDGDWEKVATRIETRGSPEQRETDLPLARSLQTFEAQYEVNLSQLLFSELDRQEIETIRQTATEVAPNGPTAGRPPTGTR